MQIVLVDLGAEFSSHLGIHNLKSGWESIQTYTTTEGPDVVSWSIAMGLVKSMLKQARTISNVRDPLLVHYPDNLYGKLADILGEAGHNAFWGHGLIEGFKYRWVYIVTPVGGSESLLIEIPDIEDGLCVLVHVRNMD